mmetsp:Transcript_57391/g.94347  ORF Transcript_57391/g.94347 Transcript_57391/m.94347 type:complete len:85 (+) Transcript_57391:32-286(+)
MDWHLPDWGYGVEPWGQVFYTRSTGLQVPAKVICLLHNGHVELEYHRDGARVVNHRCPMHSISFKIPSFESPPLSPSMEVPTEC